MSAPPPRGLAVRIVVGALIALGLVTCGEVTTANFLSFNLLAMSGEGKRTSVCLSKAPACQWSGWQTARQLRAMCPTVQCIPDVERYAYARVGPAVGSNGQVMALAVGTFHQMVGDLWLGDGDVALHCVDMASQPGPIKGLLIERGFGAGPERDPDERCAGLPARPDPGQLRATLIPSRR